MTNLAAMGFYARLVSRFLTLSRLIKFSVDFFWSVQQNRFLTNSFCHGDSGFKLEVLKSEPELY